MGRAPVRKRGTSEGGFSYGAASSAAHAHAVGWHGYGSGMEGFVARGLGSHIAATVSPLFLSVVVLGIPAGALVAGEYLRSAIGGGTAMQLAGALLILVGAAVGARVQRMVSWALLLVVVALGALTAPQIDHGYRAVIPTVSAPGPILPGMVVAFWAYVGFENLTFIAGEFRNPRRDFPLAMLTAFLVYGGLSVALTVLIAALIPRGRVSALSGLFQLAELLTPAWLVTTIMVAFALAIMQLNAASWLWGMSRLMYASARTKRLPAFFAHLDRRGLPRRVILALGIAFVAVTGMAVLFPTLLVSVLTIASSVFLFLYLLCLLSYVRLTPSTGKRLVYGVFFLFLLATLLSVGLKILYPTAVFLLAWCASILRERGLTSRGHEEERERAPGTMRRQNFRS